MDLSNNLYRQISVNSTCDLEKQNVVADRKIDLEFKKVLTDSSIDQHSYIGVIPKYKDAEIYDSYSSSQLRKIGKGTYSVVRKGTDFSQSQKIGAVTYTQKKIEQNYHSKNLTPPGSFFNKIL